MKLTSIAYALIINAYLTTSMQAYTWAASKSDIAASTAALASSGGAITPDDPEYYCFGLDELSDMDPDTRELILANGWPSYQTAMLAGGIESVCASFAGLVAAGVIFWYVNRFLEKLSPYEVDYLTCQQVLSEASRKANDSCADKSFPERMICQKKAFCSAIREWHWSPHGGNATDYCGFFPRNVEVKEKVFIPADLPFPDGKNHITYIQCAREQGF
jgi:hypothetical protein